MNFTPSDIETGGIYFFVALFLIVIGFLYRVITNKDKKYDELQEKRLQDAKDYNMQQNTAITNMSNVIEKIYDAVTRSTRNS